jgi:outer membrane biosynthesis protein TonB
LWAQDAVPRGDSGVIKKKDDAAPAEPSKSSEARLTKFVEPEYPAAAKAKGLETKVVLELIIDAKGKVQSATVVNPGPTGEGFDEAAL